MPSTTCTSSIRWPNGPRQMCGIIRARPRRAGERAPRQRLSQHRLRALHPRDRARRGYPRRPVVVGKSRIQRMRASSASAASQIASPWIAPTSISAKARPTGAPALSNARQLDHLESEAIYILRETAAEFANPVLLFSGGKDSTVLLRLAEKAFRPGKFPFPLLHVDTGQNFPEVIEFRDRIAAATWRAADRAHACRIRSIAAASGSRTPTRAATRCRP